MHEWFDLIWCGNTGGEKHISRGSTTSSSQWAGPQRIQIFWDPLPMLDDNGRWTCDQ